MIEWGSNWSCNKFDAEEDKSQTNQELYLDDEDVQTTWKNIYFQRKSKKMRKSWKRQTMETQELNRSLRGMSVQNAFLFETRFDYFSIER